MKQLCFGQKQIAFVSVIWHTKPAGNNWKHMRTSSMADSLPAATSACLALALAHNLHVLFVAPCSTACPNATCGLEPPSSEGVLPPLGTALFGRPNMRH